MNTGKFAAYKQVTPPNSDLSGVINQQERLNNFKNLREERKAEKDKRNQLGLTKDLASINSGKQTKFLNFEHSLSDAFHRKDGLIEKYANAQKRLELNPSDTKAAGILSNIKATVGQIAATKTAMLKYSTALTTGIANGTISKELNKGFISNMKKINEGGVNFEIDDIGSVKIFNTGKTDLDGDGIGMPDEITLETLTDKNNFGIYQADFDLNEYNTILKTELGTFEQNEINPNGNNPYETLTTEGLNAESLLIAKDRYKSALGQSGSSLTNDGKSLLAQYGITQTEVKENPEKYEKFIKDRVLDLEKSMKKKRLTKIDQAAIDRNKKFAYDKAKDEKEEEEEETKSPISLALNDGNIIRTKNVANNNASQFSLRKKFTITLNNKKIEISTLNLDEEGNVGYEGTDLNLEKTNAAVDKTTKSKKNGKIDKKTGKLKGADSDNSTFRGIDQTDSGLIAVRLGYENLDELKAELKKQISDNKKTRSGTVEIDDNL